MRKHLLIVLNLLKSISSWVRIRKKSQRVTVIVSNESHEWCVFQENTLSCLYNKQHCLTVSIYNCQQYCYTSESFHHLPLLRDIQHNKLFTWAPLLLFASIVSRIVFVSCCTWFLNSETKKVRVKGKFVFKINFRVENVWKYHWTGCLEQGQIYKSEKKIIKCIQHPRSYSWQRYCWYSEIFFKFRNYFYVLYKH